VPSKAAPAVSTRWLRQQGSTRQAIAEAGQRVELHGVSQEQHRQRQCEGPGGVAQAPKRSDAKARTAVLQCDGPQAQHVVGPGHRMDDTRTRSIENRGGHVSIVQHRRATLQDRFLSAAIGSGYRARSGPAATAATAESPSAATAYGWDRTRAIRISQGWSAKSSDSASMRSKPAEQRTASSSDSDQ